MPAADRMSIGFMSLLSFGFMYIKSKRAVRNPFLRKLRVASARPAKNSTQSS